MALNLRRHTTEFATSHRDFRISNSQANSYCINNHFYYEPHRHGDYFDWIYIADGYLNETINGRKHVLGPGDLAWIRPSDWHEESGRDMVFYVLCGTSQWLEAAFSFMQAMDAYRALQKLPDAPRANVPPAQRETVRRKWDRCWQVYLGAMGQSHAVQLASELFVSYFLPQVAQSMQFKAFPDWFREALSYIQNHVGEEISSDLLADVCGKSPEHVARSFQTYMATTPSQYINLTRLNYAARLLITTDRSIIDIAMTVGFGSLGHFYRLFKTRYHHSPRAYRLENRRIGTLT